MDGKYGPLETCPTSWVHSVSVFERPLPGQHGPDQPLVARAQLAHAQVTLDEPEPVKPGGYVGHVADQLVQFGVARTDPTLDAQRAAGIDAQPATGFLGREPPAKEMVELRETGQLLREHERLSGAVGAEPLAP